MSEGNRNEQNRTGERRQRLAWLEWLTACVGLILVVCLFGVLGWQAFSDMTAPPTIIVAVDSVVPVEGGYRVLFRARNGTGTAAAQVPIEGKLFAAGGEEISRVVLDYVPGHSTRRGGLMFGQDPRVGELTVRATGFVDP